MIYVGLWRWWCIFACFICNLVCCFFPLFNYKYFWPMNSFNEYQNVDDALMHVLLLWGDDCTFCALQIKGESYSRCVNRNMANDFSFPFPLLCFSFMNINRHWMIQGSVFKSLAFIWLVGDWVKSLPSGACPFFKQIWLSDSCVSLCYCFEYQACWNHRSNKLPLQAQSHSLSLF